MFHLQFQQLIRNDLTSLATEEWVQQFTDALSSCIVYTPSILGSIASIYNRRSVR